MKKTIKLWYADFYEDFNPYDNYITNLLKNYYSLKISNSNPDYLIYSCYGTEFLKYNSCVRIFYTGENLVPDFNLCDYAIGFHYLDFQDRYLRYPNFALFEDQFLKLLQDQNFTRKDLNRKSEFCNFIYANSKADPTRDDFFHILNKYKKVSSPGKHLNNSSFPVGERFAADWMYSKLEFQSTCKFTIAFENSSSPGYTTEKLMHAFIANTIPIYWGNPLVAKDFNEQSFINCHSFSNFSEVVERIKEIDQDDELYLSTLKQPAFSNYIIPETLKKKRLSEFLKLIFDQDLALAYRRTFYGTGLKYENEMKEKLQFTANKKVALRKKLENISSKIFKLK